MDNSRNVFRESTFQFNHPAASNSTDVVTLDNGVVGNYWSDYSGQGSYVIDQNNVDHRPLTQQVDISAIAPTPISTSINQMQSSYSPLM